MLRHSPASLLRALRRVHLLFPVLAMVAGASVGCGKEQVSARTDTSSLSAPVTDSLSGPGARAGEWADADERSTWRATLDGPHVLRIDEVSVFTDSTRSTREFHFDTAGALVAFHETRLQLLYGERATADTLRTVIDLEWERDSLARSAKRVDNETRLLQPYEIDNLRTHAVELWRLVHSGSATRPSSPQP